MDLKSLFGGVSIGRDTSGNIKMSFAGDRLALAIRSPEGQFFTRDKGGLKNVTDLTMDALEGAVLRLPVPTVKEGDVIVMSENPFAAAFIDEVGKGGQVRVAKTDGSLTDFEQPANLLGQRFFIKATNLLESFADGRGEGDQNLLFIMLLLGKGDGSASSDNLLPLLLMQQSQGSGGQLNNPMLLALMLRGGKGDMLDTLMLMQALAGGVLGGGTPSLPARGKSKG
jgi:hypothetical protein